MNEGQLISLVAMIGWLVLMLSGYRSYKVNASKTLTMALIWASIFVFVVLIFSMVM